MYSLEQELSFGIPFRYIWLVFFDSPYRSNLRTNGIEKVTKCHIFDGSISKNLLHGM